MHTGPTAELSGEDGGDGDGEGDREGNSCRRRSAGGDDDGERDMKSANDDERRSQRHG